MPQSFYSPPLPLLPLRLAPTWWFDAGQGCLTSSKQPVRDGDRVHYWGSVCPANPVFFWHDAAFGSGLVAPAYVRDWVAGLPAVRFSGQNALCASGDSTFATTTPKTVVVVTDISTGLIVGGTGASDALWGQGLRYVSGTVRAYHGNDGQGVNINSSVALAGPSVIVACFSSGSSSLRINAQSRGTASDTLRAWGYRLSLGASDWNTFLSQGCIAEIVYWDRALSQDEVEMVEAHYHHKYHLY